MNEEITKMYRRIWSAEPQALLALERKIGYTFSRRDLLYEAMTHRSMAGSLPVRNDRPAWNERLEFLGDAVLGLVISTLLCARDELFAEGDLSRIRASLVNEDALAEIGGHLGIGEALLLGKGERKFGRVKRSLLADALEALIGAVYEDGGFEAASIVVQSLFKSRVSGTLSHLLVRDYKTRLQELTQERFQEVPTYRVAEERGPDHAKEFRVEVFLRGNILGYGVGDSKKRAAQMAAKQACVALGPEV